MDIEPIYCAEQIVVPSGLDEVLKAFTKAAIRAQPKDLVDFAATYFAQQAALAQSLHLVVPPTVEQLRRVYSNLRDAPAVPLTDVEAACRSVGIGAATLSCALQAGAFTPCREAAVLEVVLVLLTMGCDGLGSVLRAAFDVFGRSATDGGAPRLEVPTLLQLLGSLAARDARVTPALREVVAHALDGHVAVTLEGLAGVPALAAELAASGGRS